MTSILKGINMDHLKGASKKNFWVVGSLQPGGYAYHLGPTQAPHAWMAAVYSLWADGMPIAHVQATQVSVAKDLVQGKYLERLDHRSSLVENMVSAYSQVLSYTNAHITFGGRAEESGTLARTDSSVLTMVSSVRDTWEFCLLQKPRTSKTVSAHGN